MADLIFSSKLGWHRKGDVPAKDFLSILERTLREGPADLLLYVKFTCQYCKSRQTSDTPNTFHPNGYSCEACGEVTRPKAFGVLMEIPGEKHV